MVYVEETNEAFSYLQTIKANFSQFSSLIEEIESELNLKLWFQLSGHLIELSEKEEFQKSVDLIDFYNRVVLNLERTFNPMKLMILISNIVKNENSRLYF